MGVPENPTDQFHNNHHSIPKGPLQISTIDCYRAGVRTERYYSEPWTDEKKT